MIYLLSRLFSRSIALPCALSLTFMTYHIYFSQDGRMYSLIMFLGMAGLYFFMKHLETLKRVYLLLVALFFAMMVYTSYSTIPFVVLSQTLFFYRTKEDNPRTSLSSLFVFNRTFSYLHPLVAFYYLKLQGSIDNGSSNRPRHWCFFDHHARNTE
jgi:uncharacterized membrane protein